MSANYEQCVVCAHPYDREENDHCPNCENSSLEDFGGGA